MHLALLASVCLLREVEASTAVVSAWTFDHEAMEVTWMLPPSKSDHLALGATRTWGCLCDIPNFCCSYHLAVEHITALTD